MVFTPFSEFEQDLRFPHKTSRTPSALESESAAEMLLGQVSGWVRPESGEFPSISISGDDTLSIPAGTGYIVSPETGTKSVKWPSGTLTLNQIQDSWITTIAVDSEGIVIGLLGNIDPKDARTHIILGTVTHIQGFLDSVQMTPSIWGNVPYTAYDLSMAHTNHNITGGNITVNVVNTLAIDISSKREFFFGGAMNQIDDPNIIATGVRSSIIMYMCTGQSEVITVTDTLPVAMYNPDGETAVQNIPLDSFTAFRLYQLGNKFICLYGQAVYSSLSECVSKVDKDSVVIPELLDNAKLLAIICTSRDTTDLRDDTNTAIIVPKQLPTFALPSAPENNYIPPSYEIPHISAGTGAISTNVQTKLREWVTPEDFGATGNGITDDAPFIKKALEYLISRGGGILRLSATVYKCATRIGTFVNANNITIFGYGSELKNCIGITPLGLLQFGDAALNPNGLYTASDITVRNVTILGVRFTSSNIFNVGIPDRWSDQMPISINTAENVLIRDCYFENWDFSAIDFGARCVNCLVDACSFYSSQLDAGHANYGVRIFCYSIHSYVNFDLSPTDLTTGVLKAGYSLPPTTGYFGHENVNVTNCHFQHVSHGVMVSAARRGIISNNRFVNCSTRSISLSTFTQDYLCSGNTHSLDTNQQTSLGVSVFYGIGQATYRNCIQDDHFTVIGATNNATGFGPIKCYINSHNWAISGCKFQIPDWSGSGGRCISVEDNSDGEIRDNVFNCPNVAHPVTILPAVTTTAPNFQQGRIRVIGNVFEAFNVGAIQVWDTTSSPEAVIIKDNIIHGSPTRFVAANASSASKLPKLFLQGNQFLGSPVRYIDNITANKALILSRDVLEVDTFLTTGGGVENPSTTNVTFDFSTYHVPACFTNGSKKYMFTVYGNRANAQLSTDFYFSITGDTVNSVSGDIIRNAGTSFQVGQVALKIIFEPYIT